MTTKPVFNKAIKRERVALENAYHNLTGQDEIIKLISFEDLIPNKQNPYPLSELEDLVESISLHGLEQNLLVQQQGSKYLIIAGHRRYYAIKRLLEIDSKSYEHLEQLYCKVIREGEDETLVRIRLHETNLQARPLNKMCEEEKIEVFNEYLSLIKDARDKKLKIKGKEVKGKTRKILADLIGVSERTVQTYITLAKGGGKIATPDQKKKTVSDELRTMAKKIATFDFENTTEENEWKAIIIGLLNNSKHE